MSRWLRALAGAMTVGLLVSTGVGPSMSECEREVRDRHWEHAAEVCLAGYERTGGAEDLKRAAEALMNWEDLDQRETRARELLDGSLRAYAEGHRILSYTLAQRGDGQQARYHAISAFVAHLLVGDERRLTSDVLLLSRAARKAGDLDTALAAAEDAISRAQRGRDPHNEFAARIALVDMLRRKGAPELAGKALTAAFACATDSCERSWAHLKKAMNHMERGQDGYLANDEDSLAMLELSFAKGANGSCHNGAIASAVALNEARLLRRKDPAGALARLDQVARSGGEVVETLLLRGYLAADRGALAEAGQYFARAERLKPPDLDWPWEIALARAELSELSGGWFSAELAEYHYRRAIARVESFRSTAPSSSAHLVSSHRGPYDGLIALFARAGRWRDALAVILELDAGDVLRGPSASRSKPAPAVAVDEVLSAWRGRDLVIVIAPAQRQIEPNRERAYRLRIANGQVTGEDVGSAREAQRWAWKLFVDPEDRAAAQELGRMIVPPGSSRETLDVLPIGPLGRVPLAALRDGDGSLILQRRPLARILAVRPRQGAAGAGAGSPVVIADPQGDLFSAAFEGHIVAGALGGAARLSGAWTASRATRDQLWAARGADLLHIAAHVGGDRHVLSLADGEVTPAEIVQRGLAPRLAVLASCGSAAVWSEEGWGSLASAFLAAGTSTVVATDRSVDDGWSHSLMRDFYTQPDWRSDPARALAAAQQRMAAGASPDERAEAARVWAAFFVLRGPPAVSQPTRQISAAW